MLANEIFKGNPEHTETFSMFFAGMFVMHFMGTADSFKIPVVRISEDFYTLMNKNIMYKKISGTVQGNPHTDPEWSSITIKCTYSDAGNSG